jgi:2-dehydropantoate 2-reductase
MKNIGVVGVGGVGGFFGGKLAQMLVGRPDLSVSFIARGDHLRAIQNAGLTLKSEQEGTLLCKPSLATDNFEKLPPLDLCLICVKEFDLASVLLRLRSKIAKDTVLLPLLNGVDIYSRIRRVIEIGIVLPACVYVGTHIESPGTVSQRGGSCKILFGPDPSRPDWSPHEILKLFGGAQIKGECMPNVETEIWKKFIFICSYGLVSAAHGTTLGQILDDPALKQRVESVVREVISVARASGVELSPEIGKESLEKGRSFPYETKTSFQRDFERRDKPDERDLYAGAMIRMALELGIRIPTTQEISAQLDAIKPLSSKSEGAANSKTAGALV